MSTLVYVCVCASVYFTTATRLVYTHLSVSLRALIPQRLEKVVEMAARRTGNGSSRCLMALNLSVCLRLSI